MLKRKMKHIKELGVEMDQIIAEKELKDKEVRLISSKLSTALLKSMVATKADKK